MPSGYTYNGFSSTQGSYSNATGIWNVGTLANGATATLTVTATVNATGDYLNLAEVTDQDQPDSDSTPDNGVDTDGDGDSTDDPDDEDDGDGEEVMPFGLGSITGNVSLDDDNNDTPDTPQVGVTVTLTEDLNNNGVADPGEPQTTTTTDANGDYEFPNLPAGDYLVTTMDPNGADSVSDEDESNDGDLGDTDTTVDNTIDVTLGPDEDDTDNNFVDELLSSIAGDVTEDLDNDDNGDTPISGVTIELYEDTDGDGVLDPAELAAGPIATDVTDANGEYEFTDLPADDYIVTQTQPAGLTDVSDEDESPDGDANDSDTTVDNTIAVTTTPGEDDTDNNFVEETLGEISGTVSLDDDDDGTPDSPQAGVTVTLTEDLNNNGVADPGEPQTTTTTDSNGEYSFPNLEPGDYLVTTTDPTNGQSVSDEDESNDGDAGDTDTTVDNTIAVTVTPGESDEDNDFVDKLILVEVGNFVWEDFDGDGVQDPSEDVDGDGNLDVDEDTNNNGILDPGEDVDGDGNLDVDEDIDNDGILDPAEPGINGVIVNLFDATTGTQIATTNTMNDPITGEPGFYEFVGLNPGDYFIEFETPTGFITTMPNNNVTGTEATDSDVDGSNGTNTTATFTLISGRNDDIDAGVYQGATIGDFVWDDSTGNLADVQDPADTGINGVTVNLYDQFGTLVGTTVTMNDPRNGDPGFYEFTDLPAGNYQIEVVLPNGFNFVNPGVGSGTGDSDIVNTGTGRTSIINVTPGSVNNDIDAGFTRGVLPVEIVDFYGEWNKKDDQNDLTWITASEINNDYFIVERSYGDIANFKSIGRVEGRGNSSEKVTYDWEDMDIAKSGKYFYRLQQFDFDGSFSYSEIISIDVERDRLVDVNLYPNPAIGSTTVQVTAAEEGDLNVTIYDLKGKVISNNIIDTSIESGSSQETMDISDLPAGSYVVRIKVGRNVFIEKLSVIR